MYPETCTCLLWTTAIWSAFEWVCVAPGVKKNHVGPEGCFSTWLWSYMQGELLSHHQAALCLIGLEAYSRLGLGFDPPYLFFLPSSFPLIH